MAHVEANDLGAEPVIGAGADCFSNEREAEKGKQRSACPHRHRGRIDARLVEQDRAEFPGFQLVGHLHVARVGPEADQQHVHHDDRHRHQQHELGVFRARDEGIDERVLHGVTEHEKRGGNRQNGEEGIEAKGGKEQHRGVHGDGHHLAVRKVDHAHHAEDH